MNLELKKVKQFSQDELLRQLVQLEENIDIALKAIINAMAIKLRPTNRKTETYAAKVFDLVMVDTTAGDVSITMPAPSPLNAGQTIGIVTLSASNNVNLSSADGRDTLNGGATDLVGGSIKLTTYISSGEGWYSA